MIKVKKIKSLTANSKTPRILGIFAHPDDETLRMGGILLKATGEGIKTYIVCITKGEKGGTGKKIQQDKLTIMRRNEFIKATKLLKVKKSYLLDYNDGDLINSGSKLVRDLKKIIRNIKPTLVVTHDPSGMTGHPDHIFTSSVVYELKRKSKINVWDLYFVVHERQEKKLLINLRPNKKILMNMPQATHYIELSKEIINIKVNACKLYKSQKLELSKSIGLVKWNTIFNVESLHKVNMKNTYRFRFVEFNSLYFHFIPI